MNAKIVATLAVAVMVFAGVAAVVSMDDVSAADGDVYHKELIQVEDGDVAELKLVVTQAEFIGSKHVLTWYSTDEIENSSGVYDIGPSAVWASIGRSECNAEGTPVFTPLTTAGVTVTADANVAGAYTFSLPVSSDNPNLVKAYGLKCEITMETSIGVSKTYSIYYTVPVQKVSSAAVATTFEFGSMAPGTVGQKYGEKVVVTKAKDVNDEEIAGFAMQSRDNYFWYAQDLPDGLAMSENGYISGIPLTAIATGGKIVTVTATEKETGNVITGKLTIVINPRSASEGFLDNYKYTVSVGSGSGSVQYENPTSVIVETDLASNVVLNTLEKTVGGGSGNQTITYSAKNMYEVKVIGDDGKASVVLPVVVGSGESGKYMLPINGTGAYRVVMTAHDASSAPGNPAPGDSESFHLFVTAQLGEVAPGIIPTGN